MKIEDKVRRSFYDQAFWCGKLGSPFMERLMRLLGENLDDSTITGARVLGWHGEPGATGDAVGLRLASGLHALTRRGELGILEPFYNEHSIFTDDEMNSAFTSAIAHKDDEIYRWLDHAPQTNEVRRASVIYAALLELAQSIDLPFALYELGASGGLNLQLADFSYEFDGKQYGSAGSSVQLSPQWKGKLPANAKIEVISRKGCDLNPLYVGLKEDDERLMAYIWPDQFDRIARTEAAINIAKDNSPELARSDAAIWLETLLRNDKASDYCRVIYHTIAWQYFPSETKARLEHAINAHGAEATSSNPLVWVSFEMSENNKPHLTAHSWPGGEKKMLAAANAHVQWINWFG